MTPGKTSFGAILKVNGKLLHAFLLGGTAWLLWPSKLEWWGFALLSVIVGLAAIRKLIEALLMITKLYAREKEFAAFAAQFEAPVPSEIVDKQALKDAGMTDDN